MQGSILSCDIFNVHLEAQLVRNHRLQQAINEKNSSALQMTACSSATKSKGMRPDRIDELTTDFLYRNLSLMKHVTTIDSGDEYERED